MHHLLLIKYGGDSRVRTGDLLLARQALSQLSYIPISNCGLQPKSTTPPDAPHIHTSELRIAQINSELRYPEYGHRSLWWKRLDLNQQGGRDSPGTRKVPAANQFRHSSIGAGLAAIAIRPAILNNSLPSSQVVLPTVTYTPEQTIPLGFCKPLVITL